MPNPFIFGDPYDDWDLEDDDDEEETCIPIQPRMCQHVWVMYNGLLKSFEYCEKCDKKRDDV